MRILVALDRLGPVDGPSVSVMEMAEALSVRGNEFVVAYSTPDSFVSRWEAIGATLIKVRGFRISRRHPVESALGLFENVRRVSGSAPDVVYCPTHLTLPFTIAATRRMRVPSVVHVRIMPPEGSSAFQTFFRKMINRSTVTAFVTEDLRTRYEAEGLVRPGTKVAPECGMDPSVYRPPNDRERARAREALGVSAEEQVVLFLGRVEPGKGVEVLIEAVGLMNEPRPTVVVAGAPYSWHEERAPSAKDYANSLERRAPPGVLFVGRQDDNRVPLWAADVVAVPSVIEDVFPRVAIEAMACGVPVVASRIGGLPEILSGELDDLLFLPGDPHALAAILEEVLEGTRSGREWRETLPSRVAEHFSLDRVASGVESLLAEALVRGPGTRRNGAGRRREGTGRERGSAQPR